MTTTDVQRLLAKATALPWTAIRIRRDGDSVAVITASEDADTALILNAVNRLPDADAGWEHAAHLAESLRREELRRDVFDRDRMRCLAPILAEQHGEPIDRCRGRYGQRAVVYEGDNGPVYDLSALTIEHVKFVSMMGRRAPSDEKHTLVLCWHHNVNGWANTHKEWEREYLRSLYGDIAA